MKGEILGRGVLLTWVINNIRTGAEGGGKQHLRNQSTCSGLSGTGKKKEITRRRGRTISTVEPVETMGGVKREVFGANGKEPLPKNTTTDVVTLKTAHTVCDQKKREETNRCKKKRSQRRTHEPNGQRRTQISKELSEGADKQNSLQKRSTEFGALRAKSLDREEKPLFEG